MDTDKSDDDVQPSNSSCTESSEAIDMCSSDLASTSSIKSEKGNETRKDSNSNISELVLKSKKAAFSLWTLLHAKNCRLGPVQCSHPGCSEAKLMFLHHKTCPARLLEPCPTKHKGCQDSRKLLAHYSRCRATRARQSQNPSSTKKTQQHVCLICSLVARHAKFALDRISSKKGMKCAEDGTTCHYIPSLNLSHDSYENGKAQSMSLFSSNREPSIQRQPRFAFSRRENSSNEIGSGFQALQAAVSCALSSSQNASTKRTQPVAGHAFDSKSLIQRPRAESMHASSPSRQQSSRTRNGKSMSYLYLAAVDKFSNDPTNPQMPEQSNCAAKINRRRSLSCTVPSSRSPTSSTVGVNKIMRKSTVADDLQYFLGEGM